MKVAGAAGAAAHAIMAALSDGGVEVVCLSPGSRSTPLVLAAAEHPRLDVRVIGDERSAGYYAIGLAKSQRAPVAVVCTSGTAAANLVPAAAEAMRACVPIVLITADRPPEIRDYGSAQTIDQLAALSGHVRWQAELLVPGADTGRLLGTYHAAASRAVASATIPPGGPVHLNVPFREPLFCSDERPAAAGSRGVEGTGSGRVEGTASGGAPFPGLAAVSANSAEAESREQRGTRIGGGASDGTSALGNDRRKALGAGSANDDTLAERAACTDCNGDRKEEARVWVGRCTLGNADACALAETLARCGRGLIVAGADAAATAKDARGIRRLAAALGWPLLADPVSGVRFGGDGDDVVVDAYDVLLRSRRFSTVAGSARAIVRVGGLPVSKALLRAVEESPARQIVIAPPGQWPDPFLVASDVVWADPTQTCEAVAERIEPRSVDGGWLNVWQAAAAAARRQIDRALESNGELFEGRVARALCERLAEDWLLWVGNSMPVRDLDTFVSRIGCRVRALANRGASGIDGTLSSALGAASAQKERVALLVGDLAFLHDVGGLQIAARQGLDLLIVVVNNDGGGIFSLLPQAELGEVFEKYFVTPHGLDLAKATEMARGQHRRAGTPEQLDEALDAALGEKGLRVVEAVVSRETNRRIRDAVVETAAAAVDDVVEAQMP